ncbi:MAG: hypothetical protein CTY12_00630 [Methylotenera sp.]|nr:MAG: hypothetical protein CTY12_00630 [Methylotenera sp.]
MRLKVTFSTTTSYGAMTEIIDVPNAETSTIKEHLNRLIRKDLDQRDYNCVSVRDIVLIEDIKE